MTQLRRALVMAPTSDKLEVVNHVETPALKEGFVLCRVGAVGLNPADTKFGDYTNTSGCVGGFDYAGTILDVGPGVTKWKVGDRVAGFEHGYNTDDKSTGAFAEMVVVAEDLVIGIPEGWTIEQGASLGTSVASAGFALHHCLGIPLPEDTHTRPALDGAPRSGEYVLVAGAATATGMIATQFLRLAGFQPVATCSPSSAALVVSLGAVATFDYRSPTCGADIRHLTSDRLTHALDCIGDTDTMAMCYVAIGTSGGRYIALNPPAARVKYTRRDISADWAMALVIFGRAVKLSGVYGRPVLLGMRELRARICAMTEVLIARGELQPPPLHVRTGGLQAVQGGIDDLRKGNVPKGKLIYTL